MRVAQETVAVRPKLNHHAHRLERRFQLRVGSKDISGGSLRALGERGMRTVHSLGLGSLRARPIQVAVLPRPKLDHCAHRLLRWRGGRIDGNVILDTPPRTLAERGKKYVQECPPVRFSPYPTAAIAVSRYERARQVALIASAEVEPHRQGRAETKNPAAAEPGGASRVWVDVKRPLKDGHDVGG